MHFFLLNSSSGRHLRSAHPKLAAKFQSENQMQCGKHAFVFHKCLRVEQVRAVH